MLISTSGQVLGSEAACWSFARFTETCISKEKTIWKSFVWRSLTEGFVEAKQLVAFPLRLIRALETSQTRQGTVIQQCHVSLFFQGGGVEKTGQELL